MNTRKTINLVIGLLLALVTVSSAPAGGDGSAVRLDFPDSWQVLASAFHKYGVSPYPDFIPWQSAAPAPAPAFPAAAEPGQAQGITADQHGLPTHPAAAPQHHMQQQQDSTHQQQPQQQQQHPLPGSPAGQGMPQPVLAEAVPAAAADHKLPEHSTTTPPTDVQPPAADQAPPPPAQAPVLEAAAPSRQQRPPPVRRLLNLAELSDGASVLAANLEARRPERAIDRDVDSFMKNDCDAEKWMMIELSQLGTVETIKLTMKELYSSRVHTFRVLGRASHPRKDSPDLTTSLSSGSWQLLGSFTAENKRGTQSFSLPQRSRVRYLLLMFDTHYGSEQMCAMNCIEVLGVSAAQELEEALALHEQETEQDEHLQATLQHQHIQHVAGQTDHHHHHQIHHQNHQQQQQQPEYHDHPSPPSRGQGLPPQSSQSHHHQNHQQQHAHMQPASSPAQDQAMQASHQQLTAEGATAASSQESTAVQTGSTVPAAAVMPPATGDVSRQDVYALAQQQQPETPSSAASAAVNGSSSAHHTGQQQQQQQPPHAQPPSGISVPLPPEASQHEAGSVLQHDLPNSAATAAAASHTTSSSSSNSSTPVLLEARSPTGHPPPLTHGPGSRGSQGPQGPQHTTGPPGQGITPGAGGQGAGAVQDAAAAAAGGSAAATAQPVLVVPSSNIQQQHSLLGDTGATGVSAGPDLSIGSTAAAVAAAVQDTLPVTSSSEHHGGVAGATPSTDVAQHNRPAGPNGGAGNMQQVIAGTGPASSSAARETGSVLDSRGSNNTKQAGNLFDVIKSEMMQLKLEQGKLSKKVDGLSKHASEADGSLAGLQHQQASLAVQLERLTKRVDALAAAHAASAAAQQQLRKDVSALLAMQTERSKYTHRVSRHHASDDTVYTAPAEGVLHDVHVTAQPGSSLDMPRKPFMPPICARPAVEAAPLLMQSRYQWGVVTALASTSLMGLWVVLHPKSLGLPQALRLVVCVLALLNGILAILLGVWLMVMHGLHQQGAALLVSSPVTSFPLHKMLSNGSSWEGPPF